MDMKILLDQIADVVLEAGKLIYPLPAELEIKSKEGSSNFVTKYDSMVQEFLIRRLSGLIPEASFVGEEDNRSASSVASGYTFIIDPIDGTTNFICNFMASAICVGLALDGIMEIGVVYNPFRDELFKGYRGGGSFLNGKPLQISSDTLESSTLCIDTAPYNPELRDEIFRKIRLLSEHCMDIRDIGSAALSICYVACGRSSGYLSARLCVWDYAAASVILTEAGGAISGEDGQDLNFATHVPVIAGSTGSLKEILTLLQANPR
jgi:myo-inositol-1(or 4)-monophosphatase